MKKLLLILIFLASSQAFAQLPWNYSTHEFPAGVIEFNTHIKDHWMRVDSGITAYSLRIGPLDTTIQGAIARFALLDSAKIYGRWLGISSGGFTYYSFKDTIPTSGQFGYWTRSVTTLNTTNAGDAVSITGLLKTTDSLAITKGASIGGNLTVNGTSGAFAGFVSATDFRASDSFTGKTITTTGTGLIGGTFRVNGTGTHTFAGNLLVNRTEIKIAADGDPTMKLDDLNSSGAPGFAFYASSVRKWLLGMYSPTLILRIYNDVTGNYALSIASANDAATLFGNLTVNGAGTHSFAGPLQITSTSSQFVQRYDASHISTQTVDAAGMLTIAPTAAVVAVTGDVDISAHPYGELYASEATLNTTLTTQSAYYTLTGFTTTGDVSTGCTVTDSTIRVLRTGTYNVSASISAQINNSNEDVDFAVCSGTTGQTIHSGSQGQTTFHTSGDPYNVSFGGLMALSANDYVKIKARNQTSAGKVLTVHHANIRVWKIN